MLRRTLTRSSLVVLAALAGCVAGSGGKGAADAPLSVDELNGRIELVFAEAESTRQAVADAFAQLELLTGGEFDEGAAAAQYAQLVTAVDFAERQVEKFRSTVEPMVAAAEPVFRRRQQDIAQIASQGLRERGEQRLVADRERYEAIAGAANAAREQFALFSQALKDHVLFLGHDLNPTGIAAVQEDVRQAGKVSVELNRQLEATMLSARAYVEQSSLPAAPPSGR